MSEKKKEYKSIKVPEEIHEKLKSSGLGISKSIEALLETHAKAAEKQVKDVEEVVDKVADALGEQGFFDIAFRGASITGCEEDGDDLHIKAELSVHVPNSDLRQKLIEAIEGKEEVK